MDGWMEWMDFCTLHFAGRRQMCLVAQPFLYIYIMGSMKRLGCSSLPQIRGLQEIEQLEKLVRRNWVRFGPQEEYGCRRQRKGGGGARCGRWEGARRSSQATGWWWRASTT